MGKKSIKYNKLVRDKIPEIIEADGKKAVVEVLDMNKCREFLNVKLAEELLEYQESGSIEELADIMEIIYALIDSKGISREQFDKVRMDKLNERGGFKKRLLLKEVVEP
jgi:predicted house-cleaning noncanonical NTP pyrophosphatase (MazG superfamily)